MFAFTDYINPYAFFIALILGLLINIYFMKPKKYIVKWPTPENAGKIIYKDDADNCYKYDVEEVNCPDNKKEIKSTPPEKIMKIDNKEPNVMNVLSNALAYDN